MPLTILLADDSMTAQKMGKEILLAAGYEVIAVSNGAAAAKKLADKPDILILDVFMPGYTGLEICEKVRASMEMAKTPVLLTVGKMEHFDPQDSARVKADGLIIKPFEATDLLAAVKKLEKKIAPPEEPAYEKTMILNRSQIQEFKDASYDEWKVDAEGHVDPSEIPAPPPMEMSMEMGSAPAFADMMSSAPSSTSMDETVTIPPPIPSMSSVTPGSMDETVNFPPIPRASSGAAAAFDETVNFPPVIPSAEPSSFPSSSMDETIVINRQLPMEPVVSAAPSMDFTPIEAEAPTEHAVEFTSAPRGADAKVTIEPALEPDHADVTVPMRDPALVTDASTMATEFATKFGVESEPQDSYVAGFEKPVETVAPISAPASDDDFEARVAAAMSSYESGVSEAPAEEVIAEAAPMEVAPVEDLSYEVASPHDTQKIEAVQDASPVMDEVEPEVSVSQLPPDGMQDAALVEQMQQAFADLPVETAPHVEEEPVAAAPIVVEAPPPVAASATEGPDLELANALAAAVGGELPQTAPFAAAAGHLGVDSHALAQVIGRVMERMMPSIMTEVAKELEASKK